MTKGEALAFVALHLKGDNTNAVVDSLHFKTALLDICARCEPTSLTQPYTGIETDGFRLVANSMYIRTPNTPMLDIDILDINEDLSLAVVFFICSYLSNKDKVVFEQRAEKTISLYVSNLIP